MKRFLFFFFFKREMMSSSFGMNKNYTLDMANVTLIAS